MPSSPNLYELSDAELAAKTQIGDSDALMELSSRHSGICMSVYKKYSSLVASSGHTLQDLWADKDYVIYHSAKTYDPAKGSKFSTWLANQMRYHCLNTINNFTSKIQTIDVDEENINYIFELGSLKTFNQETKDTKTSDFLDYVKSVCEGLENEKIKKVIIDKYFPEDGVSKSYTEISKKLNVTVQTVINWHDKFIKIVKNKIDCNDLQEEPIFAN